MTLREPSDEMALVGFLDEVGATLDAHTQLMRLARLQTPSASAFQRWLHPFTDQNEHWSYEVMNIDGQRQAIAAPTTDLGSETSQLFAFVEIHQLMVVWWLTAAWRARQLIEASVLLSNRRLVVPSAACAHGLVETSAQFRADAAKVAMAWDKLKSSTDQGRVGETSLSGRTEMLRLLHEATAGGKFDDKVPDLQAAYGKVNRSNVLGAVEKMTKTFGATWQEDYQWLCNVVHPSVGNYFAFSSPAFRHESGTHMNLWFSGEPLEVVSPGGEVRRVGIIETAISRATERSAQLLLATADDALRVLDDVALTTRAAEVATIDYWRNITVRDRQASCPCRSGKRAYRCIEHQFGLHGPTLSDFPYNE